MAKQPWSAIGFPILDLRHVRPLSLAVAREIQNRVAWLSLDDGDNDPTRFLTYFIAALQQIDPNLGQTVQRMLHASQPQSAPAETLMTALINDISASSAGDQRVIVLDDYYVIKDKPIDDTLTFLLDHLPPLPGGMHLVIATRDDPYLPLARLRAWGQLTELRATDLRFTSSEAAEFPDQVMGLDLSAESRLLATRVWWDSTQFSKEVGTKKLVIFWFFG